MVDILNTTKQDPLSPRSFFGLAKDEILGKNYELSLAFIGDTRSRNLNKKWRKKDYVPNVLSFPLEKDFGEIFINLRKAKSEAKDFDMTQKVFIQFLYIHALLHLKGLDHGKKMDKLEQKYLKKFTS